MSSSVAVFRRFSTRNFTRLSIDSIRRKLSTYQTYQETLLSQWLAAGKKWPRPGFRVVFLTRSVDRAYHILSFTAETPDHHDMQLDRRQLDLIMLVPHWHR